MLQFLLVLLASFCAFADSITVEITPDRHAIVREIYSISGPSEFVFLAGAGARVEKIHSAAGHPLEINGSGPWFTVRIPPMNAVDLSYEVVPTLPSPRSCGVPILMPKHAVDSVSVTIADFGSGLRRVSVPHLVHHRDLKTWTATFPAVPSHFQLEWETGNVPPAASTGPAGLFAWNFWGLAGVLVTWTIAYLLWARRQAF